MGGGEAPGVSTDVEASPGEGGATGAGETPTVTTDSSFPRDSHAGRWICDRIGRVRGPVDRRGC